MLISDYNNKDPVIYKLVEKAESIAELRKNLINYTNNFREFKNMKPNLINDLFTYEDCFYQLTTIIKTVTENNLNYKKTFEDLKKKHLEYERKILSLESENNSLKDINKNNNNNILQLNEFNRDKDSFIKDLISKVNYFENVLREYQKKYYIPKFSKILEYGPKLVDSDKIKKLYNNMKIMEQIKMDEFNKVDFGLQKDFEIKSSSNDLIINNLNEKVNGDFNPYVSESNSEQFILRPKSLGNFRGIYLNIYYKYKTLIEIIIILIF